MSVYFRRIQVTECSNDGNVPLNTFCSGIKFDKGGLKRPYLMRYIRYGSIYYLIIYMFTSVISLDDISPHFASAVPVH